MLQTLAEKSDTLSPGPPACPFKSSARQTETLAARLTLGSEAWRVGSTPQVGSWFACILAQSRKTLTARPCGTGERQGAGGVTCQRAQRKTFTRRMGLPRHGFPPFVAWQAGMSSPRREGKRGQGATV